MNTIVINQPTFLPWIGWFDLADQANVLILLDDVAFSKQSWQQRNRIRTRDGLSYITVPVRSSGRMGQRILETELADRQFIPKLERTIAANYSRARYFEQYYAQFCEVVRKGADRGLLCELNCALIGWLAGRLGVSTPRLRASELPVEGQRGAYVAKLCQYAKGERYLSPAGAEAYLLEDLAEFTHRGITVELQVYEHPAYRQCFEPFQPYASALDLLFNEGEAAGAIMRSGRRSARTPGTEIRSQS